MFRHLRVKLTVLYAGLFSVALLLIGGIAYAVINGNTQRMAAQQLASSEAVFDRLSRQRIDQFSAGAAAAAESPSLVQAVATRSDGDIRALLQDLSARTRADLAFVVTREGLVVGAGAGTSVPPGLQAAFSREAAPVGVMRLSGQLHLAATAPLPEDQGWVVLGARLDASALEALSPMPLQATVVPHGLRGWEIEGDVDADAISALIDQALQAHDHDPHVVRTPAGPVLLLTRPLPSLDGVRSVLLLRFPLTAVLSPYRALFGTLALIGLVGVAGLVAGSWFLSRSITQPLSSLEEAAKHLQEGVYETVTVNTKDELSRLAESFNAMIGAIRERERRITQLAYHDAETRLPNRSALERRLAAAPQAERLYLAAIGLDRFAHVRGAIGYALAGLLVRTLGQRLARLVPNAPMSRLSSDVLGVAFLADNDADARKRADALVANLEAPLSLEGQAVDVNVTIGLAQPRAKDESPAAMIERASIALDQTRAAAHKVGVFDKAAYGDPARNLSLMGEMRRAIESGEMELAHQPKYDFRAGRIHSAESLIRWKHPTRGMISPDLFIPMAEETGHMRALTEWVLRRAVEDQKRLAQAGWPLTLAVNISARLLSDTEFARSAVAIVRNAPHQIAFEITETAVIDNPKAALDNIDLFAANGIRVAIDDYGSGLSSLAYLKQLPAHELKIDKMFVESLTNSQRDALLVRSTIDLAHGLGLEVTAEGVETPAVFALLASMRCDYAQGYLVSRPATLDELIAILGDERRMRFYEQTATSGAIGAPTPVAPSTRPRTA
ncbi:MAG: putative bifunctional diguanylate cyclase/phosphodiesterase [Hyphomonadaceae bacterium]